MKSGEEMKLQNKIALVTGGAEGIGRQICLAFARQGADVIVADINIELARKTADEINAVGCRAQAEELNVADAAEAQNVVNKILDKFKKIDILVNNAGITRDNLLMKMPPEDWEAVIKVNLSGAFNCIRAVSRAMLKQRSGKIINIASIIGLIGNPGQANYSASKAGLIALTKTTAKELASRNINVNAVAPGFISTRMTQSLSEEVKGRMFERIPLGRFGKPDDIAAACVFLASSDADYITGQTLIVDGGMT